MPAIDATIKVEGKILPITIDAISNLLCGYHCYFIRCNGQQCENEQLHCVLFNEPLEIITRVDGITVGKRLDSCLLAEKLKNNDS